MGYQLTQDDLVEHLRRQVGFIERSAEAFDAGFSDEAVRLAQVIRVLVHDTGRSTALLNQLGVKDTLLFVDTALPARHGNLISWPRLVFMQMTAEDNKFIPALDSDYERRQNPRKHFAAWWADEITRVPDRTYARRDYSSI
jgi:hypothetical protein